MRRNRKFGFITVAILLTVMLLSGCSAAKNEKAGGKTAFPTKPIEVIVPFSAGGAVDITVRILAAELEKDLNQKVLIVNKPGGGGIEGQSAGARANPDGYTLVALTGGVVTNTLTKQLDFSVDSFQPIVLFNLDPHFLVVPADSPFKTLADFIAAAKAGTITSSTPGHSTANHTSGLLLEKEIGANFKFIHTKGAPEQIPMIAGGHAQSGIASWGEVRSMIEQGKVRALGILAEKRDPRAPEVATFKEQGVNLAYGSWRGIAAPKGTPPEVLNILSRSFQKAIEAKEVKDRFAQSGFPLVFMGPDEFAKHLKAELDNTKAILSLLKK